MGQKHVTVTAIEEVEQTRKYNEAAAAAGWEYQRTDTCRMLFPFCARRQVRQLHFARLKHTQWGETWDRMILLVALANHEYERTYLSRMNALNNRTLAEHGLTDDAGANAALGMCL